MARDLARRPVDLGPGVRHQALDSCIAYGFQELGLEKILAAVYSGNEASLRSLAKTGFCQAGMLRRHVYFGGEWHDECLSELLRDDWKASR